MDIRAALASQLRSCSAPRNDSRCLSCGWPVAGFRGMKIQLELWHTLIVEGEWISSGIKN